MEAELRATVAGADGMVTMLVLRWSGSGDRVARIVERAVRRGHRQG